MNLQQNEIDVTAIRNARATMRAAFDEHPDFLYGYVANIACLLQDRYAMSHASSNAAATAILELVFRPCERG